jgi:hypothetical protein
MAQVAYQGHTSYSSSAAKAVTDADNELAPADRNNYDPTAFTAQPGAGARAKGYPRSDGRPN